MELSHERGSGESRDFLECFISEFGEMCENCFKVSCIVQALSIASWQNSNTSFRTAIEQSAQLHQAKGASPNWFCMLTSS